MANLMVEMGGEGVEDAEGTVEDDTIGATSREAWKDRESEIAIRILILE